MSDISKNLMQDETIIRRTQPHWIIFMRALLWLVLAVLVFLVSALYPIGHVRVLGLPQLYQLIPAVLLVMALLAALPALVMHQCTEFIITNKRVLSIKGFLRRQTTEILLSRIESISIYQSLSGRILDYGTLLISGTGGSSDPFEYLPNPAALRNSVQEQVEKQSTPS